MKTVKEVSCATGVSIRTLHHYDAIGLLKPSCVTEAGYRLYDETALERLHMILVFRELGLSLRDIGRILDAPDYDRNRALQAQIEQMQDKITHLKNRITLAKGILVMGVNHMNFEGFDHKKLDEYSAQARALYGKTDAYKEYTQKSKGRSPRQEADLGRQVMDFFLRLGQLRPCEPDSPAALAWARELQAFFTEHYYNCTPEILCSLADSYAGGGSLNENIDKAGGEGTGAFAKAAINAYLDSL